MLDFFKIFTKKLNAFFDGHGITDAVLNYGPMFEGEIYMSLEKYITPIPDQFINKLITLNLTEDELAFINSSAPLFQVGFVLSEFLPQAIVTYNPEAVDIQSGVDVYPATSVAPAAPTAPTTTVVVPPWLLSQSTPAAASATTAAPNPNPPSVNQTQYGGKKRRYTNRRRRNHRKATRKH